jgi:hypothetical protein
LKDFLDEVRDDFRKNTVELIYGTVRLIERDDESFLPWARQRKYDPEERFQSDWYRHYKSMFADRL